MEFAILGPLEARDKGRRLKLGGPKQRAVLAILLLDANRPVSRDRLIDGLWGESPPPSAAHTLDDYVSRLRRTLGGDRFERRPAGYLIRIEPGELDLERFEALLEQGRSAAAAGDAAQASGVLGEALDLWRGRALADLENEPFAASESRRLEERRLLAVEARIEAELELGRGGELVGELERLVAEHPFRERGDKDASPLGTTVVRYTVRLLRRLGYQAHARIVPSSYWDGRPRVFKTMQLISSAQANGTTFDMLGNNLACDAPANRHFFCDHRLDRAMRDANTLEAKDPRAAAIQWARIDRDLVDQAAWVPLVNIRWVDFVSAHVHNYEADPTVGLIADQAWLQH